MPELLLCKRHQTAEVSDDAHLLRILDSLWFAVLRGEKKAQHFKSCFYLCPLLTGMFYCCLDVHLQEIARQKTVPQHVKLVI